VLGVVVAVLDAAGFDDDPHAAPTSAKVIPIPVRARDLCRMTQVLVND
jgi:hypothetical protein